MYIKKQKSHPVAFLRKIYIYLASQYQPEIPNFMRVQQSGTSWGVSSQNLPGANVASIGRWPALADEMASWGRCGHRNIKIPDIGHKGTGYIYVRFWSLVHCAAQLFRSHSYLLLLYSSSSLWATLTLETIN